MSVYDRGRTPVRWRFEWKSQDAWFGIFWKIDKVAPNFCDYHEEVHIWICFVPCIPLHLSWYRE